MKRESSFKKIATKSFPETFGLGEKIGQKLQPNDVIALYGDLGAGKTVLAQGIGKGMGAVDLIASPTFIIINEYCARLPFYHIDLYRLDSPAMIKDIGIEEYFSRGGVCVIEWAERLGNLLPEKTEKIKIKIVSENEREICVSLGLAARLK